MNGVPGVVPVATCGAEPGWLSGVRLRWVLAGVALLGCPVAAAGPNLCREQEDALFACRFPSQKVVSVCGVYDAKLPQGYSGLVYRYGSQDKVELTLPAAGEDFRRVTFTDETVAERPVEDDMYLRFAQGAFSYLLYSALGKGFEESGLAVFRGDALLEKQPCVPGTVTHDMGENQLLGLGVQPEVPPKGAMRFWRRILPKGSAVLARGR